MDTAGILIPVLSGAVAALIGIRLTFRRAATARDALLTPLVFAICGGLVGISSGMIWVADREGRVTIEKGMAFLICGATAGAMVGGVARNYCLRMNRGKATISVLVVAILGGSIGAPLGWIEGDVESRMNGEFEREQLSASRMMWGAVIGSCVGLLVGLSETLLRRRGVT